MLVVLGALAVLLVVAAAAPASTISQKKARLRAVEANLSDASTQSEIAVEKFNQASSQLDTVNQQIDENQHQLDVAVKNLQTANQQLKLRAENMYKTRDVGFVDVLFKADSFDELISQMDMMQRLGNSDVDTVHAIAAYKRDIKDRKVKLEADQKVAARLVAEREMRKNELIALQGKLAKITKDLKGQIKRLKAAAKLRAKLALIGYGGPIPAVDPNSPGHPEIVALAQRYLGVPYVWGGASPSGFDCSGLAMYCYAQIGIQMSHGATDQQRQSLPVPLSDVRAGDLVFFGNASFSHHVAIVVGGTTIIEAPYTGAVVRYGTFAGRDAWIGGRF